jgi:hypothetical protein
MDPKTLPTIWGTYMKLVTKYQISAINSCGEKCWTYMHIFLSNYWWQRSDILSQASYRYPISWEAFFDPSDSYFLFAKERKCDEKCAYMFNVYRNQLSRQIGSRNLTGPKMLPTIWHSCWEKCDEKCAVSNSSQFILLCPNFPKTYRLFNDILRCGLIH